MSNSEDASCDSIEDFEFCDIEKIGIKIREAYHKYNRSFYDKIYKGDVFRSSIQAFPSGKKYLIIDFQRKSSDYRGETHEAAIRSIIKELGLDKFEDGENRALKVARCGYKVEPIKSNDYQWDLSQ